MTTEIKKDNTHADVLAFLAATLVLPLKVEQKILVASRNLYYLKQASEINKDAKHGTKNKMVYEVSSNMESKDW